MDRLEIAVRLLSAHISRGAGNTHNEIPANGGLLEGGYDKDRHHRNMADAALDLADALLAANAARSKSRPTSW